MKNFLKIITLALTSATLLSFASCGGNDTGSTQDTSQTTTAPYPSPDYTSHPDVMTINGKAVTYEEYRYYFLNVKYMYDRGDSDFWKDNSYDEEIKEETLKYITRQYAIEALAKQHGVELTSEDYKELDETIEINKEQFDSIDEYNEYLDYLNLTDRSNYRLAEVYILENMLYEYLTGAKSDFTIQGEKTLVNKFIESYVYCADWIILYNDYGDDKNENKTLIDRIKSQLDGGSDFTELKIAYSEDTRTNVSEAPQYIMELKYDPYIQNTITSLEEGKTSDVIELPYGYAIVKRYEKDSEYIEKNFDSFFVPYYEQSMFEIMLDNIEKELDIVYLEGYDKLTVATVE